MPGEATSTTLVARQTLPLIFPAVFSRRLPDTRQISGSRWFPLSKTVATLAGQARWSTSSMTAARRIGSCQTRANTSTRSCARRPDASQAGIVESNLPSPGAKSNADYTNAGCRSAAQGSAGSRSERKWYRRHDRAGARRGRDRRRLEADREGESPLRIYVDEMSILITSKSHRRLRRCGEA